MTRHLLLITALTLLTALSACSKDDGPGPGDMDDEATEFLIRIDNVSQAYGIMSSGIFNTPVGAGAPGPLLPGEAYEFDFTAGPGSKLSLATMFVQSNDLFYAPDESGIALFDGSGGQLLGDQTSELSLWDAGTEQNQVPGVGPDQAPRQSGANSGAADSDATVRLVNDGYTYPVLHDAIQLTLTSTSATGFRARVENVAAAYTYPASGIFNTPVGAGAPAPIGPGAAYEVAFDAAPGSKLSFATMFIPSNDFFIGPGEAGIDLYDGNGNQVVGDVTAQLMIWDSGTEINQEPGLGPDQAQRQGGPNTGAADPDNTVRLAPDTFGNLPAVDAVVQATLTSTSETGFVLRIENVSDANTLMTSDGQTQAVPMAPGIWVVHTDDAPYFTVGQPDRSAGLEAIAEDGNPAELGGNLAAETGLTVILSPGVWTVHMADGPLFTSGEADRGEGLEDIAEDGSPGNLDAALAGMSGLTIPLSPGLWTVHESGMPIFTSGQSDRGEGLESIAEDGSPGQLEASLTGQDGISSVGIFNTPAGEAAPAPIAAGQAYEFTVSAQPGEYLSLATMFIQSNDLFIGPSDGGMALFDAGGNAISGDVTAQMELWDAGTEVNEEPGVGLNQAPRQVGANVGVDENGAVQVVDDGFSYPSLDAVVRVTVTPQ